MRPRCFLTEDLRQVPKRIDGDRLMLLAEQLPGGIFLLALFAQAAPLFLQGRRFLAQCPLLG